MTREEQLVRGIVKWCSKNGQAESRLLYPNPQHYVFTFELFDMLAEESQIPKEKIAEWFNDAQEEAERGRR
jgi:hypothetical protein